MNDLDPEQCPTPDETQDTRSTTYRGQTIRITGTDVAIVREGDFAVTVTEAITYYKTVDLGYGMTQQPCPRVSAATVTIESADPLPDVPGDRVKVELWSAVEGMHDTWGHLTLGNITPPTLTEATSYLITYRSDAVIAPEHPRYASLRITRDTP